MNLWSLFESAVSSTNPKYWTATYQANRHGLEKMASAECIPCSMQSMAVEEAAELITNRVKELKNSQCRVIYSQPKFQVGYGLFPKDDISEEDSTEPPVI
jgi:hypothetical protein